METSPLFFPAGDWNVVVRASGISREWQGRVVETAGVVRPTNGRVCVCVVPSHLKGLGWEQKGGIGNNNGSSNNNQIKIKRIVVVWPRSRNSFVPNTSKQNKKKSVQQFFRLLLLTIVFARL